MTPAATRDRPRRPGRRTPLARIVREVVSIPTASFREQRVHAYLAEFAERRGLDYHEDRHGNGYITYRRGRARRPLVLGAHTDHPGFVVTAVRGRRLTLEFRGGLGAEYGAGEFVRLYGDGLSGDGASRARITSIDAASRRPGGPQSITGAKATLEAGGSAEPGDLALWDVEECRIQGRTVHARQCDDLIGVAAILATLDRLAVDRPDAHVIGLFTRAEEAGLLGAAAAAGDRTLPEDSLIVAVETSSMAGGRAEQGAGPIIRVGDAQHIFSPRMTMWMTALARELQAGDRSFTYQRKLMDGGTTEATAYDLMGYETGAACVALGNYHNAGPRGRVRAETVHLDDIDGLARLFVRMSETSNAFERYGRDATKRWRDIGRDAAKRLRG